ncbi:MAG: hypothetical protein RMY16_04250 [Nostoc sp. DedQUE12b]|uniref:hypothetical protein n=1 Tax=Nostoc sp. DedQUE12b TaxID=3075398 RepID=UPI002AD39C4F|nr:hypothetical protein [Nostoc sp. DedQUE12b]MDZ8084798.1 hypothetical protein [Nostoc sp. DedQUE12b]
MKPLTTASYFLVLNLLVTGFNIQEVKAEPFNGVCNDPWVTGAVSQVAKRSPLGQGNRGECNIRLYGNGRWSNFPDLLNKVKKAFASYAPGVCRDPWITGAVSQVAKRSPQGYGELGECDMYRYGNGSWSDYADGSWSDYADLVRKIRATFAK